MWLLGLLALAAIAMFFFAVLGGPDQVVEEAEEGFGPRESVDAVVPAEELEVKPGQPGQDKTR